VHASRRDPFAKSNAMTQIDPRPIDDGLAKRPWRSSFCPLLISLETEENSERRGARLGALEEFRLLFKALKSRSWLL
jgi:hypothetical protein